MRSRIAALKVLIVGALFPTLTVTANGYGQAVQEQVTPPFPTGDRVADRPKFIAASGWTWIMPPREIRLDESSRHARSMIVYPHVDSINGGLRIFVVETGPEPRPEIASGPNGFRLVVYDEAGQRYIPRSLRGHRSWDGVTHVSETIFVLGHEILRPEKAAFVGAERLMPKVE